MGSNYYLYFICIIWRIFNKLYNIGDKVNINKRDILKVLLSFIIFFYIGSIAVLICRGFLNIDFKNHPIYVLVLEAVVELIIGIIVLIIILKVISKIIIHFVLVNVLAVYGTNNSAVIGGAAAGKQEHYADKQCCYNFFQKNHPS